ncbi:cytochrome b [Hyphomicrobium sp. DMF-1]|jgi:cytochrome b561|uniref:cytochrome b n=1 Tax=Hyphomicrobium sp. DMF-1 TaxID=3019544 RepID=UPI0022EC0CBA|nr:cytochrome b [Hyphomicrobium sp. DMF-1]WBT38479.1 cytochrome b [Hyphomicrobium sp. DMF-1]
MFIRDTLAGYGLVSRLIHWLMAIAIFAMFGLGLWMVDLDYYSPYYHTAPSIHKGVGILLLIALAVRFGWRLANVKPSDEGFTDFEKTASRVVHRGFYPLLLALMVSGYLISTADGRPIDVFGLFSVPSPGENKGLEDTAGVVHAYLAYFTIALAAAHAAGALKHHFVDRDRTLSRMWSGPRKS